MKIYSIVVELTNGLSSFVDQDPKVDKTIYLKSSFKDREMATSYVKSLQPYDYAVKDDLKMVGKDIAVPAHHSDVARIIWIDKNHDQVYAQYLFRIIETDLIEG